MEIQGEFVVLNAIQSVGKVHQTTHQTWVFHVTLQGGKPSEFEYNSETEARQGRDELVSILQDRESPPAR